MAIYELDYLKRGVLTEEDEGQTKDLVLGASFSISLPAIGGTPRPAPRIEGAYIRLRDQRVNPSTGYEVFEFIAEGAGEAVIRILTGCSADEPAGLEYVLRVRIRSASEGHKADVAPRKHK